MQSSPAVFRDKQISALLTNAQENLEERLAPSEK